MGPRRMPLRSPDSRWSEAFAGCCARATTGHTAAPPSRVMNSRRLMPDMGVPPASALPVYRTLSLLQRGRKVLGPELKCSESG